MDVEVQADVLLQVGAGYGVWRRSEMCGSGWDICSSASAKWDVWAFLLEL